MAKFSIALRLERLEVRALGVGKGVFLFLFFFK